MKKAVLMRVDEDTPNIPVTKAWFLKIEKLGDVIQFRAFEHGLGVDFLYRFKTEYGVCYGKTNPLTFTTNGYFNVLVPQADEPLLCYCADERVIATIQNALDTFKKDKSKPLFRDYEVLTDDEVERVYTEDKIPRYTLI